ncbi:10522_t:CDS:2 [Gigaspora rosea]|nr:10522_t:CDS:2 [Gigaspora rosea]
MNNIENKSHLQLGESFSTQEEFFEAIQQYGLSQGFTIRYGTPIAKKDDDKPKRQKESK